MMDRQQESVMMKKGEAVFRMEIEFEEKFGLEVLVDSS